MQEGDGTTPCKATENCLNTCTAERTSVLGVTSPCAAHVGCDTPSTEQELGKCWIHAPGCSQPRPHLAVASRPCTNKDFSQGDGEERPERCGAFKIMFHVH